MAHDESHGGGVQFYFFIALVLGVITYLEFAIIEFDIAWLSNGWTLFWLIALSLLKFALVVAIYMHLRSDDPLYTGFFGSGMVIALGTFIALSLLFTVRSVANNQQVMAVVDAVDTEQLSPEEVLAIEELAEAEHSESLEEGHGEDEGGHGGVPEDTLAMVSSNGYSRPLSVIMDTPPPKRQQLTLQLPASPEVSYTLLASADTSGGAAVEESAAEDSSEEGSSESSDTEAESSSAASEAETSEAETSQEDSEETAQDEGEAAEGEAEAEAPVTAGDFEWQELGQETYSSCVGCHQANGQGVEGAFPPLAGHIPALYEAEGGREYIINVVLYGLQGEIEVDGVTYNGVMNAWGNLSDEQVAAVLNHELTDWGNAEMIEDFQPLTPDEVAALRDQGLSASDVHEQRMGLELP